MISTRRFPVSQNKSFGHRRFISHQHIEKFKLPLLLTLIHIPFGVLVKNLTALAFICPIAIFFVGLYFAVRKAEKLEKVAYVVVYLIGAEVLWRMAKAPIPWEFGKYGAIAVMMVALIVRGYWKIPLTALLYVMFLIPACFSPIINYPLGDARNFISFNMSGPFLIFVSCWFFSYLKINENQLKKLLTTMFIPIVSIAIVTLFYAVTKENIKFQNESNASLSGGFGPNQVSSILGLGVFLCLSIYLLFRNNTKETIYLGILATLFAGQSVLTFSRGGMYNAIGAIIFVIIFQLRNPNQAVKRLLPILGIGIIFLLLVFPFINNFTGGFLEQRFEDTQATGRFEILEADLQIFLDHPVLGAGIGEAKQLREDILNKEVAAHTEFSRVLAEHGLFGILALICLGVGVFYCLNRQKLSMGKALVMGLIVWSSLYMTNAGLRIAAPSVLWGMTFLTIETAQTKRKNFDAKENFRRKLI